MVWTEGLLKNLQRALVQRLGQRVLALVVVEPRKVVQALGHIGMVWTEGLLPNRQRALVQRLGQRVLALVVVEPRKVVQALGHIGMVWTEGLLGNIKRLHCYHHCAVVLTLLV